MFPACLILGNLEGIFVKSLFVMFCFIFYEPFYVLHREAARLLKTPYKISGNCKDLKYCFKMVFMWQIQNKQCSTMESISFRIVRFVISPMIPVVFRYICLVISITFPLHEWAVFPVIDVLNLTISPEKRADTAQVMRQKAYKIAWFQKLTTLSRNKKRTTI